MVIHKWNHLRCDALGPEKAFEELCAQISRNSPPGTDCQFIRNGTPDGGIEFYWETVEGNQIGWQCKFFTGSLTPGHWDQLDESFNKAVKSYENLTKYIVALPLDMAQGRDKSTKSLRDKWNERVKKWQSIASHASREIEIQFYGSSEIFDFLTRQDQQGRFWYWFDQTTLTQEWFEKRLRVAIKNAGARYTPELNIELPISKSFEFLCRTKSFRTVMQHHTRRLTRILKETQKKLNVTDPVLATALHKLSNNLLSNLERGTTIELVDMKWEETLQILNQTKELLYCLSQIIEERQRSWKELPQDVKLEFVNGSTFDTLRWLNGDIQNCISRANEFSDVLEEVAYKATDSSALLIIGEAGIGKTHLLCDSAKSRIERGAPTVILYGENFRDDEPWKQICTQLQLGDLGSDKLLQALDCAGQAKQERTLIIIDGINEGAGRALWKKQLPGMLEILSDYKWVAIALSIRSGYEDFILGSRILEKNFLVSKNHTGFSDIEFDAIPQFCMHYKLSMPSIPIIFPDFQNPLFLKLTCESLSNSEHQSLSFGSNGITATFSDFIHAFNIKISEKLGLDTKSKILQTAVDTLSIAMAETGSNSLQYEQGKALVNQIHSSEKFDQSLFKEMLSEGILTELPGYSDDSNLRLSVRFSYEKFSDHLVAKNLLSTIHNKEQLTKAFSKNEKIGALFAEFFSNRGLIEALAIQIPEKFGIEVSNLVSKKKVNRSLAHIIMDGLKWRNPSNISDDCIKLLTTYSRNDRMFEEEFFDLLFGLSAIPNHPLNANFLHKNLIKQSMPQRDAWWTIRVSEAAKFGHETGLGRLINWFSKADTALLSKESAELLAVTLTWLLSSPNRQLRDKATKALVQILASRLDSLLTLLETFKNIDEPYITERIYATAYGCILRTNDVEAMKAVAEIVWDQHFKEDRPVANILVRDYARGIIDICARSGAIEMSKKASSQRSNINSALPKFPTPRECTKYAKGDYRIFAITTRNVYNHILGDSDFASSVLNSNLHRRWLKRNSRKSREGTEKNIDRYSRKGAIDSDSLKRWIFKKVLSIGWTEQDFGRFDYDQKRSQQSRYDKRFDGISEKYAWIALYELLALLHDSADFNYDSFNLDSKTYGGPWQLSSIRNIDPSRLEIAQDKTMSLDLAQTTQMYVYDFSDQNEFDDTWVSYINDLPNPLTFLETPDWLILDGSFDWSEPPEPGAEEYREQQRHFAFSADAFFVQKDQAQPIAEWLLKQDMFTTHSPATPSSHDLFLGEFFRTDVYSFHNTPYFSRAGWSEQFSSMPFKMLAASDRYYDEPNGLDQSFDNPVNISMPCDWIVSTLKLAWDNNSGFSTTLGEKVSFDPASFGAEQSRLVFRKTTMKDLLKRFNLALIWYVRGRKCVLGANNSPGITEMTAICQLSDSSVTGNLISVHVAADGTQSKVKKHKLEQKNKLIP